VITTLAPQYKTEDGTVFDNEDDAWNHQMDCDYLHYFTINRIYAEDYSCVICGPAVMEWLRDHKKEIMNYLKDRG